MILRETSDIKEKTILVVDDNRYNVLTVKSILSEKGYKKILTAVSGKECISKVIENKPDLLILDIMMPDMDGFEVCRKLKENEETSDVIIVLLSARTSAKDLKKGFDLGAVDYIEKPFSGDDLVSRVESVLKRFLKI